MGSLESKELPVRIGAISVKNCFGFGDSGDADLVSPSGIVSILGRNSSGKSSLLAGILSLSPDVGSPDENDRFVNFYNPSGGTPLIWGSIDIEGELPTPEQFLASIKRYLRLTGVPQDFEEGEDLAGVAFECYEEFASLFHHARSAGRISVYRQGNHGLFWVTAPGETIDDQNRRRSNIGSTLARVFDARTGALRVQKSEFPVQMNPGRVYRELARHLVPPIFLFGQRFQLNANLPDRITQGLIGKSTGLESYLVSLLDSDLLDEFFDINDPDRRDELLEGFRGKMSHLSSLVNAGGMNPMLEFVLHENEGLQLTAKIDGKKSFYRHLSDNTKFLIGYNLVTRCEDIAPSVLLFDEPNTGFHPSAQLQLLDFLQRLAHAGHQVVITTHSEHLLDVRHICGVRTMEQDSRGLLRVENKPLSRANSAKAALALQPLFNSIGQTYGGPFPLAKGSRAVLVEGITDLMHLRAISELLGITIHPSVVPGRGQSTLPTITAFCIGQGFELKFVIDKGTAAKVLREEYLVSSDSIFEVCPWENCRSSGIEDLYSREDFDELLRRAGISMPASKRSMASNSARVSDAVKVIVARTVLDGDLNFLGVSTKESFLEVFNFIAAEDSWYSM